MFESLICMHCGHCIHLAENTCEIGDKNGSGSLGISVKSGPWYSLQTALDPSLLEDLHEMLLADEHFIN